MQQALQDTTLVKDDVLDTIDSMIAKLDQQLTIQLNEIIHAEEFQKLESAWRGLNYLVFNSETDTTLKIRVMNVGKNELYARIQSLSRRTLGPEPDLQETLRSRIRPARRRSLWLPGRRLLFRSFANRCAACCATSARLRLLPMRHFLRRPIASLMGMDSWNELTNPRDIGKIFDTPDYAAFKSLRDQPDSPLCRPVHAARFARQPYGAKAEPVEEFAFEEDTDGHKGEKYGWMNAAYAMATNVNRAFKEYGWTVRIRGVQSGGEVINLPTHTFPTDDGGIDHEMPDRNRHQ